MVARWSVLFLAVGTESPEHDLGLVYREAGVVVRSQARPLADRAVHVLGPPAAPADQVVMVVADPGLEPGGRTGRFDATEQTGVRTGSQNVVDGLLGHRAEAQRDEPGDGVGGCVRMVAEDLQHGDPGLGHPQPGTAQSLPRIGRKLGVGHTTTTPPFLDLVKTRHAEVARFDPSWTSMTACRPDHPTRAVGARWSHPGDDRLPLRCVVAWTRNVGVKIGNVLVTPLNGGHAVSPAGVTISDIRSPEEDQ